MRILWMSNTPLAGTGYGVQTAEIIPRLKAAGHDVALANNWGSSAAVISWNDITVFPTSKDRALNDVINAYADLWHADWTISLYDVWTMQRDQWPERVASWVPVDHQPCPPEVAKWCSQVNPIAMSRFGQRMLKDQGIESTYIPHSVNLNVFHPTDALPSGRKARATYGIPDDAFLVMIAAANQGVSPPRKAWGEMFDAMAMFMSQHPDVWLYVHTDSQQKPPQGVDLPLLARQTGVDLNRVRWADSLRFLIGQIPQTELAALYSAADVLLASSMGEGFGIPVLEAQACGLPVIVSDFSAQSELCGSGWMVKGQPWRDPLQHSSAFFLPYIPSIIKQLGEAYAARGDKDLRERAVAFAADYDTDKVFERYWVPYLAELQALLDQPVTLNRAERRRQKRAKVPA